MTRVILSDDHAIVREGLRSLLEATGKIEVVGETDDGQSTVALTSELLPDVVIIDLVMPGLDGIEATREIKKSFPHVKVIVLSMYLQEKYVRESLKAGASGYVAKSTDFQGLINAVEAVMRDEMYLSTAVSKVVIDRYVEAAAESDGEEDGQVLSEREREVLKLVAQGSTNKKIAELLNLSEKTVAAHRGRVMRKLGLENISQLIRYAIRSALIDVDEADQG